MAKLTYPLNLADLKQTVSILSQPDQTGLTIEQRLNLLGQTIGNLASADKSDEAQYNLLVDKLQEVANDLKSKIDAIDFADNDTVQTISDNLSKLKTLIEGDAGVTIINTLDALADEVNALTRVKSYVATINGDDGKATIDISGLGLSAITDYSVQVSQDVTNSFSHINIGARKVDEKTIEVQSFDMAYTPETIIPFNGANDNAIVNVMVSYLPQNLISIGVIDTDGDTQTVGN